MYNCHAKISLYLLPLYFLSHFPDKKGTNTWEENIEDILLGNESKPDTEIRQGPFFESGFALLVVRGLSFPLLFAFYLEADTNAYVKLVRPLRERYIDVTKLSATPRKNTAVLPIQKYALSYGEGLDERERKWQSTAGITLRFLPQFDVALFGAFLALVSSEEI